MHDGKEELANIETKNGTAFAVEWLLQHEKDFADHHVQKILIENLRIAKQILDDNLEVDPKREKDILDKSLEDFFDLHQIDSVVRKKILQSLAGGVEILKGEKDPRSDWWDTFPRQSNEGRENLLSTLLSCSGSWKASFEIENPNPTSGAKELKISLNQFVVDLASIITRTADKEFKYVPELDPSTQKHVIESAQNYLQNSEQKPKPCNLQSFYPLIYVVDGEYRYRELSDLSTTPIRLFREQGGVCQYLDLPLNTFQQWETEGLDAELKNISNQGDFAWSDAEDIDPFTPGPIISMSIAKDPTPDSLLYKLARSGSSIIHLNYNPDRGTTESYFNHLSFDGAPGMELALNMAEAVGTKKENSAKGLQIDFQPPTQAVEMTSELIAKTISAVESDFWTNRNFRDNPSVSDFVFALGVSDVSISNDLEREVYQDINNLCDAINNTWYKETIEIIDKLIERDKQKGKTIPDEKTQKEIKNRLMAIKMTPSKFLDLMTQQYFGSTVVCNLPRDPQVRLTVSQVPTLEDLAPGIIEKTLGMGKKQREIEQLNILKNAYYLLTEEYARTYLQDFSPLIGIQSETDWFRSLTEITAALLVSKSQDAANIIAMTSTLPETSRDETAITEFTSAQTSLRETNYAYSIANLTVKLGEHKTIRYSHRIRHNPETIDKLDILNLKDEDFSFLKDGDKQDALNLLAKYKKVASDVYDLSSIKKGAKISNLRVLAEVLKSNPDDLKQLQRLIVAASTVEQSSFYKFAHNQARQYSSLLHNI